MDNPTYPSGRPIEVKPGDITVIQALAETYKPMYDADWMNTDNPSDALLICIAMGPWKQDRRFKIADKAIEWLYITTRPHEVDLRYADLVTVSTVFPLEWQRAYARSVIRRLVVEDITFLNRYEEWRARVAEASCVWPRVLEELFRMCDAKPNGSKVLWLFARDFLKVPAFPIDRWVARNLKKHGLPANPWYLTHACLQAGVDPNELARAFYTQREGL